MSIGLFDYDMIKYKQVPLNLELAKIAAYYKKKREIVVLSPEFNPDMYNRFIIRKDYDDRDYSYFTNLSAIEYGGLAFSNNVYIPMDLNIEKSPPDVSIYERYRNIFCKNKNYEERFNVMLNAIHFRLSLDGKTIWKDFRKQIPDITKRGVLFLHDYNLNNIQNSDLMIKELINERDNRIEMNRVASKFPIIVSNGKDLLRWGAIKPSFNFFNIQYNGIMENDALFNFFEISKGTSIFSQFEYNISAVNEEEVIKEITKIYAQVLFCRTVRQKIHLYYMPNFFSDKRWEKVLDLINHYAVSLFSLDKSSYNRKLRDDTMYKYAKASEYKLDYDWEHPYTTEELREIFYFVKDKNPELFEMFYKWRMTKYKGGNFVNGAIYGV